MTIDPGIPVLGFAVLGVAAALARRPGRRRTLVNAFIAYTLMVSFGAGLGQREVWPFSSWPLVAEVMPDTITHPRFKAVDSRGREHEIDHRAYAPIVFQELMGWEGGKFWRLDPAARDRAAAHLLSVVENARARWAAGDRSTPFDRYLGPLAAPFFLGHPDRWSDGAVPEAAFVGLRIYHETWNVEERWKDPSRVDRVLLYEYRAS